MGRAERGKAKETIENILWLFKYIPHVKFLLFLGVYVIKAILEFMVPVEVGKIIDNVIAGNGTVSYIQTFVFLVIVNVLMDMLSNILLVDVQSKPTMKIQEQMIRHLFVLGIPYYENSEKGKVFSLFNTMISNIKNIYQNILPVTFKNIIQFICLLYLFIKYSGVVGLVVILFLVPGFFVQRFFSDRITELMKKQIKSRQAFDSTIYNAISAEKEIRVYQCEKWQQRKVAEIYRECVDDRLKTINMRFKRGAFFRLNIGMGLATYLLLAISGFLYWGFSVGTIVACTYYCTNIMYVFNGIVYNYTELLPDLEFVNTIKEFLNERPYFEEQRTGTIPETLKSGISLKNVSFSYKGGTKILDAVNFFIRAGNKVLLIGESGCGKTTVLKLMAGFYRQISGDIYWDNYNYSEIVTQDIFKNVGYVFQDIYFFGDTIKNNILIGNLNATDEEVEEAAKLAGIDSMINKLPEKYDTLVGERGMFLSAGERQRVALARLILKNPEIIILDESTANLDEMTENQVIENMFEKVFKDKTIISVSHRLSTHTYYDCVYKVSGAGIKQYSINEF